MKKKRDYRNLKSMGDAKSLNYGYQFNPKKQKTHTHSIGMDAFSIPKPWFGKDTRRGQGQCPQMMKSEKILLSIGMLKSGDTVPFTYGRVGSISD